VQVGEWWALAFQASSTASRGSVTCFCRVAELPTKAGQRLKERPLPLMQQSLLLILRNSPACPAIPHRLCMSGSGRKRLFSELTCSTRTRTGTALSKSRSGTGGWPASAAVGLARWQPSTYRRTCCTPTWPCNQQQAAGAG